MLVLSVLLHFVWLLHLQAVNAISNGIPTHVRSFSDLCYVQAALNSTPSVASCGLYGPQDSKLWALSQIESLHLWEWAAAVDEEVPGEGPICQLCRKVVKGPAPYPLHPPIAFPS